MKKCLSLLIASFIILNVSYSQAVDKDVNAVFTKYFEAIETNNHSKRLDTYDPNIFNHIKREYLQKAYELKAGQNDQKTTYSNAKIRRIGKPVRGSGVVYKVVDYTFDQTITANPKKKEKEKVDKIEERPEEPIKADDLKNPEDQKRFKQLQKKQKKKAGVATTNEPVKPKSMSPFESKVLTYQNQYGAENVTVDEKNQSITINQTAKLVTIKKGNKTRIIEFSNDMIPVLKKLIPSEKLLEIGKS